MGDLWAQAWAVARKDLVLEFRTRTALLSTVVFTVLVLTVFNFGRDPTAVAAIDLAPSVLWVTFTFAAMLALNRAFQLELENGALEGLLASPLSPRGLYIGKLLANLAFVGAVQATARLLANRPLSELSGWLKLLAAYDIVFLGLASLLFPHTVDE